MQNSRNTVLFKSMFCIVKLMLNNVILQPCAPTQRSFRGVTVKVYHNRGHKTFNKNPLCDFCQVIYYQSFTSTSFSRLFVLGTDKATLRWRAKIL